MGPPLQSSLQHRFSTLRWLQGPAITEIDSPHLHGGGRLTGGEPARSCPRNLPPAPPSGNSAGTNVRILWESGNRTGFPGSQRRIPGGRTQTGGLQPPAVFAIRHALSNPTG